MNESGICFYKIFLFNNSFVLFLVKIVSRNKNKVMINSFIIKIPEPPIFRIHLEENKQKTFQPIYWKRFSFGFKVQDKIQVWF